MSREFLEYCPTSGAAEFVEWHMDGTFSITTEQDVEPVLEFTKALAREQITDGNFRKEGWLYASIPAVVQLKMLQRGVDIMDPNDTKKMIDLINQDFPYCKTTHRHHAIRQR